MSAAFPLPAESVLKTLGEVFRAHGEDHIYMLLDSCTAHIVEDLSDSGWDNTTYYELHIQAKPDLYAQYENSLEKIEKLIEKRLPAISSGTADQRLIRARFMLQMAQTDGRPSVNQAEQDRIWIPGAFRVFLSHRSEDRVDTATLKAELAQYGVAAFVAHADIEVTREWENEIMRALMSMQCLVALVTPDFHNSFWCNQEIGVALGRGIQVLSVKLGAVPMGFAGSKQGMPGDMGHPNRLAARIVEVLLRTASTAVYMRATMIEAIIHSGTFTATQACVRQLMSLGEVTHDEAERLKAAFDNEKVMESYYVPGKLADLIRRHDPKFLGPHEKPQAPVLPDEDDIPF